MSTLHGSAAPAPWLSDVAILSRNFVELGVITYPFVANIPDLPDPLDGVIRTLMMIMLYTCSVRNGVIVLAFATVTLCMPIGCYRGFATQSLIQKCDLSLSHTTMGFLFPVSALCVGLAVFYGTQPTVGPLERFRWYHKGAAHAWLCVGALVVYYYTCVLSPFLDHEVLLGRVCIARKHSSVSALLEMYDAVVAWQFAATCSHFSQILAQWLILFQLCDMFYDLDQLAGKPVLEVVMDRCLTALRYLTNRERQLAPPSNAY